MPIIAKEYYYNAPYALLKAMHLITEDPRPGHNIMYIGNNYQAVDAVTLKPLWGLNSKQVSPSSNYMGGPGYYSPTNSNGEYSNQYGYMSLGGKRPAVNGNLHTHNTLSAGYFWTNVSFEQAWNMDPDQKWGNIAWHDNGNGTSSICMITGPKANYKCWETYGIYSGWWTNLPDDKELYEVGMNYCQSATTNPSPHVGGTFLGWADGSVQSNYVGWLTQAATYSSTTYKNRSYLQFMREGTSMANLDKSINSRHMQFAGISELDGGAIYFHIRDDQYNVPANWQIKKLSNGTESVLLTSYNTTQGGHPFPSYNSTYSYHNTRQHNSGTNDSFLLLGSEWFKSGNSSNNTYLSLHPVVDTNGRLCLDCFAWDKDTDTFTGAGVAGNSTTYAGVYMYNQSTSSPQSNMDAYWMSGHELGASGDVSSQHHTHGIWVDWHNAMNNTGLALDSYSRDAHTAGTYKWASAFPACGMAQKYDSEPKARTIVSWAIQCSGTYMGYCKQRSFTVVPETPLEWCWLDHDKTLIAAVCMNNTYIYQYRNYNGTFNYNASLRTNDAFNANMPSSGSGWIHTATIPYNLVQIGTDKLQRIWYVTWAADGGQYSSGSPDRYNKQLWMVTQDTPFRVEFGGTVTTDTISYSGSNINKTLTVGAWSITGHRVASEITLNITGNDAQFDNGTQSKTITTSTSSDMTQTITITGSSQFNITAAYGA